MKKVFRYIQVGVIGLVLVACLLGYYFIYSAPELIKKSYVFSIRQGDSLGQVAERLKQKKLIRSSFAFKLLGFLRNKSQDIKVGEFLIEPKMSALEILILTTEGQSIQYIVTFPEGTNIYEIAQILENKGFAKREDFLKLCHDKIFIENLLGESLYSLEGYLFPETYNYTNQTTVKQFVEIMVKKFLREYKFLKSGTVSLSRHEHVILASIIEEETGLGYERALISSVFHNRLRIPMRLQTDPTILYGMTVNSGGTLFKNIRKKDILQKTEYNTYRIDGFPKGPISNPGMRALQAAIRPVKSDFLYFVSRNDGSHVFSKTFKEHNGYVREFQLGQAKRKTNKDVSSPKGLKQPSGAE